ncbi:MAG: hypothetical protein AAFO57_02850 [Pseudomonadota bacterium]
MPDGFLEPTPPPEGKDTEQPLAKRLTWFFGISLISAAIVIIAAYALRSLLFLE